MLSNQNEIQPTLINLHLNKYSQEFHYYPSCNDLSNKVCIPNKTEHLNLSVFNKIANISESKTLTKHVSHECRFDENNVIQINGGITINVDVAVKNIIYVEKNIFGILVHVFVKMENIKHVLWMIQWLRVMQL